MSTITLLSLVPCLLPGAQDPLPPDVAATIDDIVITMEEYRDFLLAVYGSGPLEDLIHRRLLEREAERLAITVTEEEIAAEDARFWDLFLRRFRGDMNAMQRELAAAGFDEETYRAKMREEHRANLIEMRICEEERDVTAEMISQRFERDYGQAGVKAEVRHILLTPARLKAELKKRGVARNELTDPFVAEKLREKAIDILTRLRGGGDFAEVARQESHDISVHQNKGFIPGYNYKRYGPELAEAVRSAEVGRIVGPIETQAGLHVIEVTARTTTKLADVGHEIAATLAGEPATWKERNELRFRLRKEATIRKWR